MTGRTVLIIAHRLSTVRNAHQVRERTGTQVIEQGHRLQNRFIGYRTGSQVIEQGHRSQNRVIGHRTESQVIEQDHRLQSRVIGHRTRSQVIEQGHRLQSRVIGRRTGSQVIEQGHRSQSRVIDIDCTTYKLVQTCQNMISPRAQTWLLRIVAPCYQQRCVDNKVPQLHVTMSASLDQASIGEKDLLLWNFNASSFWFIMTKRVFLQ